jgi:hypothetical protein
MGPVENTVRAAFPTGVAELETISSGAPFGMAWDGKGIRVFLGTKRKPSRLSWGCLEGVPSHLRGRGWVPVGGKKSVIGEPNTFDEYLKKCVKTLTSRWVARSASRCRCGRVRIDPIEVRLTTRFET